MAASPLLLGVDLTQLNSTEVADLKNPSIVAVDQDGIDARRIVSNVNQQAYAKTEQNGDVILGLFNYNGSGSQTVTVSLAAAGITGSATATNLWTGASAGTLSGTYSVTLAAGASQILKLVPVAGAQGSTTYLAASSANTLAGGAAVAGCNSCLGGQKVGYVGSGGTLTFNNVNVSTAGNYEVQIGYLDGTSGTVGRSSTITVNGTSAGTVTYTPTGSFANPGSTTVSLPLKAGSNTIEFSNSSAYAPDFDAVTVPTNPTTSSTTYLAASATLGGGAGSRELQRVHRRPEGRVRRKQQRHDHLQRQRRARRASTRCRSSTATGPRARPAGPRPSRSTARSCRRTSSPRPAASPRRAR